MTGAARILPAGFAQREELALAVSQAADGTQTLRLSIPGMHCGGCVSTIERAVNSIPGIADARANLTRRSITARWQDASVDGAQIIDALRHVGFEAFPLDAEDAEKLDNAERRDLVTRMAVAGFASANVMLLSVSIWAGASDATRDLLHWVSALIAIPTVIYAGRPFFASALRGLRARRLNMDAPISLAVILATAVSLSEVLRGGEDAYFDAAVMLLFLLLIGRWLDRTMRDKARSAARALGRIAPRGAWVLDGTGARRYCAIEDVCVGDKILLSAGERLPVDGIVLSGAGTVDAALVTGEALPIPVKTGDHLDAGILSLDAVITVQAIKIGEDTSLAEIARLCAAAEDRKSNLGRLADKAAAIYAPVVHLIALATLIGWIASGASAREGLLAAVAVLIVTCPCALGLAAPMAQAVASGALFRRGIMLKDGAALERLAMVDHVVFDKTGVLTRGELRVEDVQGLDGDPLRRAIGLAERSSHPIARAFVQYGASRNVSPVSPSDVQEKPGFGLSGMSDGCGLRLGSAAYCGLSDEISQPGVTCWYVEDGSTPVRISMIDTLRDDAHAVVNTLASAGLRVSLLSGDRSDAVADVAKSVGIDAPLSGLRPDDKIAEIETYLAAGNTVLMVGDGINDAPALAAATVSMAPSSGSDIGRTASDLVFTGESLSAVVEAWRIARRTRRVILQNFALAAGYNAIAIPIAALGFAGPLIAAIAMSSSSLLVTLNALRLNSGDNR